MSQLYQLVESCKTPVSLETVRNYLKISNNQQDALIKTMINAATEWGQKYTGREFVNNQWILLVDCFEPRIKINRAPVAQIDSITHVVDGSPVAVDSSVYYLKKGNFCSEVLVNPNEDWPTDTDEIEQAISITFTTEQYQCDDIIELGIMQHVAYWYHNRGDCTCDNAAKGSGVKSIYELIKIPRV